MELFFQISILFKHSQKWFQNCNLKFRISALFDSRNFLLWSVLNNHLFLRSLLSWKWFVHFAECFLEKTDVWKQFSLMQAQYNYYSYLLKQILTRLFFSSESNYQSNKNINTNNGDQFQNIYLRSSIQADNWRYPHRIFIWKRYHILLIKIRWNKYLISENLSWQLRKPINNLCCWQLKMSSLDRIILLYVNGYESSHR